MNSPNMIPGSPQTRVIPPPLSPQRVIDTSGINFPVVPEEVSEKYRFICLLGQGTFADAWEVEHIATGTHFCMKISNLKDTTEGDFSTEIDYMSGVSAKTEYVVKLHDWFMFGDQAYTIMELCQGGTLTDWIKMNKKLNLMTEKRVLHKLKEIAFAVMSCHDCQIIHRDIKPDNIFLDNIRKVKLGDFGVARKLKVSSLSHTFCGTPPYMAPEVYIVYKQKIDKEPVIGYGYESEVWSLGCILLDMSYRENKMVSDLNTTLGMLAINNEKLFKNYVNDIIENDVRTDFLTVKRLLRRMLIFDKDERIRLDEIINDSEVKMKTCTPPDMKWFNQLC